MRGKQKDDYEEQHQSNNLNQTEIESSSGYDKNINEYEELKNHINGRFEDLEKKMLEKFGRLLELLDEEEKKKRKSEQLDTYIGENQNKLNRACEETWFVNPKPTTALKTSMTSTVLYESCVGHFFKDGKIEKEGKKWLLCIIQEERKKQAKVEDEDNEEEEEEEEGQEDEQDGDGVEQGNGKKRKVDEDDNDNSSDESRKKQKLNQKR